MHARHTTLRWRQLQLKTVQAMESRQYYLEVAELEKYFWKKSFIQKQLKEEPREKVLTYSGK